MTNSIPRLAALAAVLVTTFGCAYHNPHGSQALPPTTRLVSEPSGARLLIERINMQLETPCELPETVYLDDMITVSMDGYVTFRGQIGDLPQVALGTYRCELGKK